MSVEKHRKEPVSILLLGLCLLTLSSSCKKENQASGPRAGLNKISAEKAVLEIEGVIFYSSDFEKYVKSAAGGSEEPLVPAALSGLFDRFVEEKILLHVAQKQNISLTSEEKERFLQRLSLDSETAGESLNDKLLVEKYIHELVKNIIVSEEEVDEYYELHKKEFLQPERVKVSQILVDSENKAINVLKKVRNSTEEGFREIARQESLSPEAKKGGEMGLFMPGQLPYEIEKVVFSLKEGEISTVVESSYGYHIFRLDKRYEPELISREDAEALIRRKLLDEKAQRLLEFHLEELKKTLNWSSFPENLSFPYQRNEI